MAHYDQNWDDIGRNIRDVIDRAVNSRDFQQLSEKIRQTVEQAVNRQTEPFVPEHHAHKKQKLYCSPVLKNLQAVFCMAGGIPLCLFGVLGLLSVFSRHALDPEVTGLVMAGITALGGWLFWRGRSLRKMVRRYRLYRQTMGTDTHCTVKLLASVVEESEEFVRRDLHRMIDKGFFLQGHLNKEQTHFLASHESYRYYEQSRLELERRQRQEKSTAPQEPQPQNLELQEILERGEQYLAQVRKCNDDIPGEEISEKISRIELLAQRIFDRVEEHPEVIPDLKKLMEYYLPMTVKLLRAYAEMDRQPVQGETIRASKQEIEKTLDTVNAAFEKLLDDLFTDTAMDVSSDISVLNTLLAQEGLVEDGLNI